MKNYISKLSVLSLATAIILGMTGCSSSSSDSTSDQVVVDDTVVVDDGPVSYVGSLTLDGSVDTTLLSSSDQAETRRRSRTSRAEEDEIVRLYVVDANGSYVDTEIDCTVSAGVYSCPNIAGDQEYIVKYIQDIGDGRILEMSSSVSVADTDPLPADTVVSPMTTMIVETLIKAVQDAIEGITGDADLIADIIESVKGAIVTTMTTLVQTGVIQIPSLVVDGNFTEIQAATEVIEFDNNSLVLLKENYQVKQDVSTKYKNLVSSRNELIKQTKAKNEVKKVEKSTQVVTKTNNYKTIVPEKTKEKNTNTTDFIPTSWILGIIILSAFVFAWIKLFFNKNYRTIIKSGYNYNYSVKLFKEANSGSKRVSSFLNLIFVLNLSIFIYLFTGYLSVNLPLTDFKLIGTLIFSITIIYSIKYLVVKTVGFVFSSDTIAAEYISNIWLYNKLLGISLFPIIITLPYINPSMKMPLAYIGITVVFIFFIFRIIRSFQIVFKIKLSIIYWILYLCTLEILPVFVLSRIVTF